MTKIAVGQLHEKLIGAGVPVVTVRLTKAQRIELEYEPDTTDAQKVVAEQVVAAYDQAAEDAAKAARNAPVTVEEIDAAKTIADVKTLLHRMRGA